MLLCPERHLGCNRWVALAVALGCFACYAATLAPGLCFPPGDSHELTVNAARLGVPHPGGYPIYTWLGFVFVRALPFGEVAWRMNLLSALLAAAGIGTMVLVGRRLGLPLGLAAASAFTFGTSRGFWSQAVIAEVYTADVLALVVTLWLLLRWADAVASEEAAAGQRWLVGAAFAYGLSLGTHLSNLVFAPVFALVVLLVQPTMLRSPRTLAWPALAFALAAAQYLWLPLRGGRFDLYPNPSPDTLPGFLGYTVSAFRTLRFAFPLSAFPWRLALFLDLLRTNVTDVGIALALVGSWVLLARDAARFWLLAGMFLVNVAVFTQFAVPDPEVFFLPAFLVVALFAGFGLAGLWSAARALAGTRDRMRRVLAAATGAGLVASLVVLAAATGRMVDRSRDTGAEDFARNALAMLPPGAALVSSRGAFGADWVYVRDLLRIRQDVVLTGQGPVRALAPEIPRFSAVALSEGRPTPTGRLGQPAGLLPDDAWYVPVLVGWRPGQVLARISATPPRLLVAAEEVPVPRFGEWPAIGRVVLVGAEVAPRPDAPRPRVGLRTWWRVGGPDPVVVSTRLGDFTLESHELGHGNLARYAETVAWPGKALVLEDVDLVLPSTVPAGRHRIRVGVTDFQPTGFVTTWMEVGHVELP